LKTALVRKLMKRRPYAKGSALIRVCSVCGLIRDESGVAVEEERWVTKRTYEKTYGMSLAECHLTHTYGPGCFTDFMEERVRPPQSSLGMDQ
jgi:hypothetical protein